MYYYQPIPSRPATILAVGQTIVFRGLPRNWLPSWSRRVPLPAPPAGPVQAILRMDFVAACRDAGQVGNRVQSGASPAVLGIYLCGAKLVKGARGTGSLFHPPR